MMSDEQIFKKGSTTYYFSSKFFPEATRKDVFKLYSFVRVADDFVDAVPQDKQSFDYLVKQWESVSSGAQTDTSNELITTVVRNMYEVSQKYHFDAAWVSAFLKSMQMDLDNKQYASMQDTLDYIYGSAEVIGLMMARILGADKGLTTDMASHSLPHDVQTESTFGAYGKKQAAAMATLSAKPKPKRKRTAEDNAAAVQRYARLQGRAMQYINFIRDINEDNGLGRCYFPKSELRKYGIDNLALKTVQRNPAAFREFIEGQLSYYSAWQSEANKGLKAIPYRQRIALRTAVDMYNWTAQQLADNPMVVFDKKVKPSKFRVMGRAVRRSISA